MKTIKARIMKVKPSSGINRIDAKANERCHD